MVNNSNAIIIGRVKSPLETTGDTVKFVVTSQRKDKQVDGSYKTVGTDYTVCFSVAQKTQKEKAEKLKVGETVLIQGQLIAAKTDNKINLSVCQAAVTLLGAQHGEDKQEIIAIGRVTQDIELRETSGGHTVGRLPIAVNHSNEKTSYYDVELWDKYAESVVSHVKKGSLVAVSGGIELNEYKKADGAIGNSLCITTPVVGFLDRANTKQNATVSSVAEDIGLEK